MTAPRTDPEPTLDEAKDRYWMDPQFHARVDQAANAVPRGTVPWTNRWDRDSVLAGVALALHLADHGRDPALVPVHVVEGLTVCQGGEEQHDDHVRYCVPLAEKIQALSDPAWRDRLRRGFNCPLCKGTGRTIHRDLPDGSARAQRCLTCDGSGRTA
jgi:hypothetical protein